MLKRLRDALVTSCERVAVGLGSALALLAVASGASAGAETPATRMVDAKQNLPRPCVASAGRAAYPITGEVKAGERFQKEVDRFVLRLTPVHFASVEIPVGWDIGVFEPGREDDLATFTLPLRGPNGRHLYAWHFRNEDNTGPNEGSVNAPGAHREFIFSPEVGRTIVYEDDMTKMLANLARIEAFGRGTLDILDFRITEPDRRKTPSFLWMKFTACLTWPR